MKDVGWKRLSLIIKLIRLKDGGINVNKNRFGYWKSQIGNFKIQN